MTDITDTIDGLLREPLNPAVQHALVDRVCEESPDPRRVLLDLVLAHRSSDGPRLAFALWCEANGEGARAEFIRVQCESAALHASGDADPKRGLVTHERYETPPAFTRWKALCQRSLELFRAFGPTWFNDLPGGYRATKSDGSIASADGWRYEFARGFVESAVCSAADWLSHGDKIREAQPVEQVKLTTLPEVPTPLRISETMPYYADIEVAGRVVRIGERELLLMRPDSGQQHFIREVLAKRWPGITFALPDSQQISASWLNAGAPIPT